MRLFDHFLIIFVWLCSINILIFIFRCITMFRGTWFNWILVIWCEFLKVWLGLKFVHVTLSFLSLNKSLKQILFFGFHNKLNKMCLRLKKFNGRIRIYTNLFSTTNEYSISFEFPYICESLIELICYGILLQDSPSRACDRCLIRQTHRSAKQWTAWSLRCFDFDFELIGSFDWSYIFFFHV